MGLVKLNDRGVRSATTFGSLNTGSMVFIKKLTSDGSDDTLSFLDGADDVVFDDTYKEYMFIFSDMHPETDEVNFTFQVDTGTNTSYNQTITSTAFQAYHNESGTTTSLAYATDKDQAQGTAFQVLMMPIGNGNDESGSGYLHIFNPSSSVFVKHFIGRSHYYNPGDYAQSLLTAGYFNTTTALTRVQFKMSSDEIQGGTISLYGIK